MSFKSSFLKRGALLGTLAVAVSACIPTFWLGSSLETKPGTGTSVQLIWNTAYDATYPDGAHLIIAYDIAVNGAFVTTVSWADADCTLTGLASGTTYNIKVTSRSTGGENSATLPPALGTLAATYVTPAGTTPQGTLACVSASDTDGDRLPNWVETNTGVFVNKTNTGTNPNVADTDGDGISDGDEVVGSFDGLPLPIMGANPLKKNLFMEFDWMDDSLTCGAHSHKPSFAVIDRFEQAFANAPVSNPDGSTGIKVISDYGQTPTGVFNKGTVVADSVAPFGSIVGGVNNAEYQALKAANFHPSRQGYFHYALMMHQYDTNSLSSGQAELPGNDLIVSLQCYNDVNWLSNTIMHELGHNLNLLHGGDTSALNFKPNYNSVMNYKYQFGGVDKGPGTGAGACDTTPDQIINYSSGTRNTLNELQLLELVGVCGGVPINWNGNGVFEVGPVAADVNNDALFSVLTDYNDWANMSFTGLTDGDGAPTSPPVLVNEQPPPTEGGN